MADKAQVEVQLVAAIGDFRAQMGSAAKVLSDAVKQMGGNLDTLKTKGQEVERSTGSLTDTLKAFSAEQRSQGRIARFYADELASLIPVSKDSQSGLQGLLGVVLEGAAGGLSFGLAFEAAKFALEVFNRESAETKKRLEEQAAAQERATRAVNEAIYAAERHSAAERAMKPALDDNQKAIDALSKKIRELESERAKLEAPVAATAGLNPEEAAQVTENLRNTVRESAAYKKLQADINGLTNDRNILLAQQEELARRLQSPAAAATIQADIAKQLAAHEEFTPRVLALRAELLTGVERIEADGRAKIAAIERQYSSASLQDAQSQADREALIAAQRMVTAQKVADFQAEQARKAAASFREADLPGGIDPLIGKLRELNALRSFDFDASKASAYLTSLAEEKRRIEDVLALRKEGLITSDEEADRQIAAVRAAGDRARATPANDARVAEMRFRLDLERENGARRLEILREILAAEEELHGASDRRVIAAKQNLAREIADQQRTAARQWTQAAEQMGSVFGRTFGDLISGSRSVGDVFRSLFADIAQMAIQTAIKQITAHAYTAGAGAASSQAGVPVIGPALAVGAMGAMIGTVLALIGNLGSAESGWAIPKNINPILQAHGGEHVIPREIAERYESGAPDANRGGATYVTIHANDAASFVDMLRRNGTGTIKVLRELARDGRL